VPDADDSGDDGPDPTRVRAVAVHAEDVVSALETNRRGGAGGRAVLRVTPPFSGRMRARIHLDQGETADDTVVLPPERLAPEAPSLPRAEDTAAALRDDPDEEYTRERHRRRHERAVEAWRETVADAVVDRVTLTDDHAVDVVVIGD
jgi:hypothetical protein